MEIEKLKSEDIAVFTKEKTREVETDLRRELHSLKMDIYGERKQALGKKRALRKNLARVLTRRSELALSAKV